MTIPNEAVQADKTLWCVHITGPDDIVSAPDHLSAVRMANTFNAWWLDLITKAPITDNHPRMWAEPIEWPYSEGHGEDVTDPNNEYQWLRELTATTPSLQVATSGYRLIPRRPTDTMLETMAFNLSSEFGFDFTSENKPFAMAAYEQAWELGIKSHKVPSPRAQALEEASKFIDQRVSDYVQEYGMTDPSTGTIEFPGWGDEYVSELEELADGIRALSSQPVAVKGEK